MPTVDFFGRSTLSGCGNSFLTFIRACIVNGFSIFSSAFSVTIKMRMCVLFFFLLILIYCIVLIDLGCSFFFLPVTVLLFYHYLFNRIFFLHWIAFVPLLNSNWLYCVGLFLVLMLFYWSMHLFFHQILNCLVYNGFILNLEIEYCLFSNFVLFQCCISYSGLLPFHVNFRISLLISIKYLAGILIGNALTVWITLGKNW